MAKPGTYFGKPGPFSPPGTYILPGGGGFSYGGPKPSTGGGGGGGSSGPSPGGFSEDPQARARAEAELRRVAEEKLRKEQAEKLKEAEQLRLTKVQTQRVMELRKEVSEKLSTTPKIEERKKLLEEYRQARGEVYYSRAEEQAKETGKPVKFGGQLIADNESYGYATVSEASLKDIELQAKLDSGYKKVLNQIGYISYSSSQPQKETEGFSLSDLEFYNTKYLGLPSIRITQEGKMKIAKETIEAFSSEAQPRRAFTGKEPIRGGVELFKYVAFKPFQITKETIQKIPNPYIQAGADFIPTTPLDVAGYYAIGKAYKYVPKLTSVAFTGLGIKERGSAVTPKEKASANIMIGLGALGLISEIKNPFIKKAEQRLELSKDITGERAVRRRATVLVQDIKGRTLYELDKSTGMYILPGGKIEAGESALTGARRELFEETGLKLDLKKFDVVTTQREQNIVYKATVDNLKDIKLKPQGKEVASFGFLTPGKYRGKTYEKVFGQKASLRDIFKAEVRAEDLYIGSRAKYIKKFGELSESQLTKLKIGGEKYIKREFGIQTLRKLTPRTIAKEFYLYKKGVPLKSLVLEVPQYKGYISPGKALRKETLKRMGGEFKIERVQKFDIKQPSTYLNKLFKKKPGQFKKFYKGIGQPDIVVEFSSRYDIPFSTLKKYSRKGFKITVKKIKGEPLVKFYGKNKFYNEGTTGYYKQGTKEINLYKGLSKREMLETFIHERTHFKVRSNAEKIDKFMSEYFKKHKFKVNKTTLKKYKTELKSFKSYLKDLGYDAKKEWAHELLSRVSESYFKNPRRKKISKYIAEGKLKKLKLTPLETTAVIPLESQYINLPTKLRAKELLKKRGLEKTKELIEKPLVYLSGSPTQTPKGYLEFSDKGAKKLINKKGLPKDINRMFEVLKSKSKRGGEGLYFHPPTTPNVKTSEAYLGASYLGLFKKTGSYEMGITFRKTKPNIYLKTGGEGLSYTKKGMMGIEFEKAIKPGKVLKDEGKIRSYYLGGKKVSVRDLSLVSTKKGKLTEANIVKGLREFKSPSERIAFLKRVKAETGRDYLSPMKKYVNPYSVLGGSIKYRSNINKYKTDKIKVYRYKQPRTFKYKITATPIKTPTYKEGYGYGKLIGYPEGYGEDYTYNYNIPVKRFSEVLPEFSSRKKLKSMEKAIKGKEDIAVLQDFSARVLKIKPLKIKAMDVAKYAGTPLGIRRGAIIIK